MARRIELLGGIAAAIWAGAAVLLYLQYMVTLGPHPTNPLARIALFATILALSSAASAVGAVFHARQGRSFGLGLLWAAATLLLLATIASMFSIGLFRAPAAVLAIVAAIAGTHLHAATHYDRRGASSPSAPPS